MAMRLVGVTATAILVTSGCAHAGDAHGSADEHARVAEICKGIQDYLTAFTNGTDVSTSADILGKVLKKVNSLRKHDPSSTDAKTLRTFLTVLQNLDSEAFDQETFHKHAAAVGNICHFQRSGSSSAT
ncbi:MAG: hypothetical protein JWP74_2872 [Marmoricola sp.]|nr:hypothetical protein [Marmoricola sp.]